MVIVAVVDSNGVSNPETELIDAIAVFEHTQLPPAVASDKVIGLP
jgi:hypothetical protein